MRHFWGLMGFLMAGISMTSSGYAQTTYEPYYVTLFAGAVGSLGSADGTGTAARFNSPQGMATDSSGNIYIADTGNNTIRKILPTGVVTTLAGLAGVSGGDDGNGSNARFELPQGIAVDATGNVYVGDSGNYTIRKITPAGDVTTIAGASHQAGSLDGPGNVARFYYPIGLTLDPSGNIYIVDNGNNTIRSISPTGVVSTLAGVAGSPGSTDGSGSTARFNFPTRIAYNAGDAALYVSDAGNNTIRRITLGGIVSTFAGTAGAQGAQDGTGTAARFHSPQGISTDATGNIYVASTYSQTLRKITLAGVVKTLAGMPETAGSADGLGAAARFNFPVALAAAVAGHLYVCDSANHTIRAAVAGSEILSLTISKKLNGNKLLSGRAFPNVSVDIQSTDDMSNPFQPFVTVAADANGLFQYEDSGPKKRFYRAVVSGG